MAIIPDSYSGGCGFKSHAAHQNSMTKEEKLLREIFKETGSDTLLSSMPCGYSRDRIGANPEVDELLAIPVLRIHTDRYGESDRTWLKKWPGPEKNVTRWYELKNRKKVAWIIHDDGHWEFIVRD